MKAKRKMYQAGGQNPKRYKDASGTYVIGANGQKIYDGSPAKMAAAPAAKPAAKATSAAKTQTTPPLTAGESLGRKLKEGRFSDAASMVGEAFAEMPGELYRALKRSVR